MFQRNALLQGPELDSDIESVCVCVCGGGGGWVGGWVGNCSYSFLGNWKRSLELFGLIETFGKTLLISCVAILILVGTFTVFCE